MSRESLLWPADGRCDHCYAATLANRLLKDTYLARLPVVDSDITRRVPLVRASDWAPRAHPGWPRPTR
jgi:hypothetical protein